MALILANGGWAQLYALLGTVKITVAVGEFFSIDKPIRLWIFE